MKAWQFSLADLLALLFAAIAIAFCYGDAIRSIAKLPAQIESHP